MKKFCKIVDEHALYLILICLIGLAFLGGQANGYRVCQAHQSESRYQIYQTHIESEREVKQQCEDEKNTLRKDLDDKFQSAVDERCGKTGWSGNLYK